MRVTIAQSALERSVGAVSKVLGESPKTAGLLVSARGGNLTLQATNGTVSTIDSSEAHVESDGEAVVSGRTMAALVKQMPDGAVTLEAIGASVIVSYGRANVALNSISPEDFPEFRSPAPKVELSVPTKLLSSMAKVACRTTYKENDKPKFKGVCVSVGGGRLSLSASDTYRIVLMDAVCDDCAPVVANVPGEHLKAVMGMPTLGDEVTLGFSDGRVSFRSGNTVTVSNLIGEEFPNVRPVMPAQGDSRASVSTEELTEALRRVEAMTRDDPKVTLLMSDDELALKASSKLEGAITEYVPAVFSGEFVEVTVNSKFMLAAMEAMGDETLIQSGPEWNSPMLLTSSSDFDTRYLVMPMRR